ncbi:syntaxin binding protein 1 [Microbotryomycetes sp. JL201]|nr:syntaxin binding protein 1 [Microbotryomycetes sp. JL201]
MLIELLRERYLDALRGCPARWKVLVVDQYTQRMLNSVLTTYDILDQGVQQVDLITSARHAQPRLAAIYLLMPTSHNVELVLKDFAGDNSTSPAQPSTASSLSRLSHKKKDPTPPANATTQAGPRYASAFLHFVDAIESRAFSLDMPSSFFNMYGPPGRDARQSLAKWEDDIAWMSRALVNALATLGEYPHIRYYNPPTSFHPPLGPGAAIGEHIGKRLADRVQREIDAYARDNSDFPPASDPPRPRGVLFITDRSMDLYAPLMHEFTYQAMCNDLLDIDNGKTYRRAYIVRNSDLAYSFINSQGADEEKEAVLSEEDKVWTEVRHMHMKDALDKLIADFKAYAGDHGTKFGASGGTSLNDMKDMLASLPQLREAKEKLSLHLTMAEKCMAIFERKKLPLVASVEQCCATGLTPEGKTPKTLVEEMVPLLDDRSLRIIATYIMYRDGVPDGDKKRLYQHARLALHEMDAIDNMRYLGVSVTKDTGKKRKPIFKQREDEDAYDISRFQPALRFMLEARQQDHIRGTLDQSLFPFVRDAPVEAVKPSAASSLLRGSGSSSAALATSGGSLRSARPQWTSTNRARKVVNEPKQRMLVFVAGGMTYSEIRSCYKVCEMNNKDVFIGSTDVWTPERFVKCLSDLDRGGGAMPPSTHGRSQKNEAPSQVVPEPKQVSMDRRYSTQPFQPLQHAPSAPPSAASNGRIATSNQPYAGDVISRSRTEGSARSPPAVNHSPTPSQVSNATSGGASAEADMKKKKKKLFGFR